MKDFRLSFKRHEQKKYCRVKYDSNYHNYQTYFFFRLVFEFRVISHKTINHEYAYTIHFYCI